MTIQDLKENKIVPLDIDDEKLRALFGYFLYRAPTINSLHASHISNETLNIMWLKYLSGWDSKNRFRFYSANSDFPSENVLRSYSLSDDSKRHRSICAFICFKLSEKPEEAEYACLLRQIRNALAHGHVFVNGSSTLFRTVC